MKRERTVLLPRGRSFWLAGRRSASSVAGTWLRVCADGRAWHVFAASCRGRALRRAASA